MDILRSDVSYWEVEAAFDHTPIDDATRSMIRRSPRYDFCRITRIEKIATIGVQLPSGVVAYGGDFQGSIADLWSSYRGHLTRFPDGKDARSHQYHLDYIREHRRFTRPCILSSEPGYTWYAREGRRRLFAAWEMRHDSDPVYRVPADLYAYVGKNLGY